MTQDRAGVIRKVQSLLAMAAEKSGATEAERATALQLADRLMKRHELSCADIPARAVERPQPAPQPRPQGFTVVVNVGGWGNTTSSVSGFAW